MPAAARKRISEQSFASFVREMPEQILIAEKDGAVAGLGATERGDNHISDIWVAPAYEGGGLGRALVSALETRIAARGFDRATISVLSENERAVSLYRHLGYAPVSRAVTFDVHLDCALMTSVLAKVLTVPQH